MRDCWLALLAIFTVSVSASSFRHLEDIVVEIPSPYKPSANFFTAGIATVSGTSYLFVVDDGFQTEPAGVSTVYKIRESDSALVGAEELPSGSVQTGFVDEAEGVLVVGTLGGSLYLVSLEDLRLLDQGLASPELFDSVRVPGSTEAYFVTISGVIVEVTYSATTLAVTATLNSGDRFSSVVYGNGYLFMGSYTLPGKVSKYSVKPLAALSNTLLNVGENYLSCGVYDEASDRVYFGTESNPINYIVEIDGGGDGDAVRLSSIRTGPEPFFTAKRDPVTDLVYFGAKSFPFATALLVNTTELALIKKISVESARRYVSLAINHPYAYFGTQTVPGKVSKFEIASCPNDCTDGGTCNSDNVCECFPLRAGHDCGIRLCRDDCSGRGTCEDGVCNCGANYTGDYCQLLACIPGCGEDLGHGVCDDGTCDCAVVREEGGNWAGPTCSEFQAFCKPDTPFFNCSGHGTCPYGYDGYCICDEGWRLSIYCDEDESQARFFKFELKNDTSDDEFRRLVACAVNISEFLVFIADHDEGPPPSFTFTIRDETPGDGSGLLKLQELADVYDRGDNDCLNHLNITAFSGRLNDGVVEIVTVTPGKKTSTGLIVALVLGSIAVCCCGVFLPLGMYRARKVLVKRAIRKMGEQEDKGMGLDRM